MTPSIQRELDGVAYHIAAAEERAKSLKEQYRLMKRLARKDEWTMAEELAYDEAYRKVKAIL